MIGLGLQAQLAVGALAMVLALVLARPRHRSVIVGATVALLGVVGFATGVAALLATEPTALVVPLALPPAASVDALTLGPDRLGGAFMALAGGVVALAALFGIGYAEGPAASRTGWSAFALFALGMLLVPAARDVVTFLLAWELMALGSTVLLLADHGVRASVRSAAVWYAVMTHLSFLLLLAGFGVLAGAAGGTTWEVIAARPPSGLLASVAFLLLVAGFATKAGLVGVHVWLPRAHPEAPSHMSAAMSAAMVKMGVYGMALTTLRLLSAGPRWWGLLLLVLGSASALYGILQASVQSDLKRMLAYSTTENVGLIVAALGLGLLLRESGLEAVAGVALVAALLLTVSHAAFKTVLFLGAGSVLHATGLRDLDHMGGLGLRMPWTAATVGVGALGAAALPISSGFVAEWVLLQALVHGDGRADRLVGIALPLVMGVIALTIGLGLLTFTKAFGIAFLARPRTPEAAAAHEAHGTMRGALAFGAALVVGLGLAAGPVAQALARAVGVAQVVSTETWGLAVPVLDIVLHPVALTLVSAALATPLLAYQAVLARRHPRRDVPLAWGCGGERTSPRMEYTATSYTEPLLRIFGAELRTHRDVDVVEVAESPLLVREMAFHLETVDVIEERIYAPATRSALRIADVARTIQNGSVHRYVGFSFAALVIVLVVVAL
jgi:formate hydrogenlyase subunit 3/multisubunit Na+/H+ antiporter MnhD subunit